MPRAFSVVQRLSHLTHYRFGARIKVLFRKELSFLVRPEPDSWAKQIALCMRGWNSQGFLAGWFEWLKGMCSIALELGLYRAKCQLASDPWKIAEVGVVVVKKHLASRGLLQKRFCFSLGENVISVQRSQKQLKQFIKSTTAVRKEKWIQVHDKDFRGWYR